LFQRCPRAAAAGRKYHDQARDCAEKINDRMEERARRVRGLLNPVGEPWSFWPPHWARSVIWSAIQLHGGDRKPQNDSATEPTMSASGGKGKLAELLLSMPGRFGRGGYASRPEQRGIQGFFEISAPSNHHIALAQWVDKRTLARRRQRCRRDVSMVPPVIPAGQAMPPKTAADGHELFL